MTRKNNLLFLAVAFVAAGLVLRFFFAWKFPFTNDEGAYLYDAKTILRGFIPGGDMLVKSPVSLLFFAVSSWFTGGSIYAARIVSFLSGLVILVPLVIVARRFSRAAAFAAAAIWLVFSGPVLYFMPGTTEPLGALFALLFVWSVISSPTKNSHFSKGATSTWVGGKRFFLSGIFFILAFLTRKINLVLLAPLLVILWQNGNSGESRKAFNHFIFGAAAALFPFAGIAGKFYGVEGIKQLLGVGYANIIYQTASGLGKTDVWALGFTEALKNIVSSSGFLPLYFVAVLTAGLFFFFKEPRKLFHDPLFPFVFWFLGLAISYSFWPTFLVEYSADFLVPTVIILAAASVRFQKYFPIYLKNIFVVLLSIINAYSFVYVYRHPWTGMFEEKAVKEAAFLLNSEVPSTEPILTAAVIVPYLSGHEVFRNIVHPLWYGYSFIPEKTKNIFLPSWKSVAAEIKNGDVRWLLMEHLTDYAYLRGEDALINDVLRDWELLATIENDTGFRSNKLKLYKRK